MAKTETIALTDLADSFVPEGTIHEKGTFLQRAGVKLFYRVLSLTALVILALFIYLLMETPSFPKTETLSASAPTDSLTFDRIVSQRKAVFENFIDAIDKIVVGILLPLLTAILGYLFGTRETENDQEDKESRGE